MDALSGSDLDGFRVARGVTQYHTFADADGLPRPL